MLTTAWGPVGTRGGCGAGWGPGACPGGNAIQWGLRGAHRSHPNQDKHQAPSSTPPRPLSLQDPGPQAPQWLGFPDSVVNIQHERSFRNLWLPHLQLDELRKMSSQGLIELSTISNGCTHRASMYPYGTIMAVLYTRMRV